MRFKPFLFIDSFFSRLAHKGGRSSNVQQQMHNSAQSFINKSPNSTQTPFWRNVLNNENLPYFAPLLAITLFALLMTVLLWTLESREQEQQQAILYRDATWSIQKIRLGLARSQEHIASLADKIAIDNFEPNLYRSIAKDILNAHPAVVHVDWFNAYTHLIWGMSANNAPLLTVPTEAISNKDTDNNHSEILKTVRAALITQEPSYSEPIKDQGGQFFIYYAVPIIRNNLSVGVIGTLYSVEDILENFIPVELTSTYQFSLLYGTAQTEQILAKTSSQPIPEGLAYSVTPLDPPWQAFTLKTQAYPSINGLVNHLLIALVCGLSCFLFWGLCKLWRQNEARKIAQRSLQAEMAFRRSMENSTALGMRALDMEGRIIYVNPAFCRMTGWSETELLGSTPPYVFWPRSEVERLGHYLSLTLQGAAPATGFQGPVQRKDGSIFFAHMQVSPLIDADGKQIGWMGSMFDVTESKRAREELAMAYARFTTLLESLDASVSVLSPNTTELLFANRYYRQLFDNQARGHLELCKFDTEPVDEGLDILSESDITSTTEHQQAAADAKEMYLRMRTHATAREVYLARLEKWFDVRHRYVRWVDGHLAHIVIATDISARKHAEEMAHRHEEELQFVSRLTTMGEMASLLAHELNQPLGAVTNYCMGAITRLHRNIITTEDLLSALEKIAAQAMRASTIVSRIRSFVKRSVPQQRRVDIYNIVADAVGLAEITASRQGIHIMTDMPNKLPKIWLDPLLIEQVLVNLLKNAVEAMNQRLPASGNTKNNETEQYNIVKLVVKLAEGALSPGLLISVIDKGQGIDESHHERLFEPFYSTKSDGMGMGLNICRSIIESHHGRLWVENNSDGVGCTFYVLLPLHNLDSQDPDEGQKDV